MQIIDFTIAHVEQAMQIAKQNYETERDHVPSLPMIDIIPDLMPFVENGLGVAAFESDTMLGFLCCVPPFKNAMASIWRGKSEGNRKIHRCTMEEVKIGVTVASGSSQT